jgi:colanic acid/amylovoran biosynthesis glycosyltransferase
MEIAFIVDRFPSLSETFVLNQITGLIDLGYHVEIYSEFSSNDKKIHPAVFEYNLLKLVHYFGTPNNKFKRLFGAIGISLTHLYLHPVIILNSLNIFKFGRYAISLRLVYLSRAFFGKNFDVIHCHFGPYGILGSLLKDVGINGKIITTFHGHDVSVYIRENGPSIYRRLFRNGDLFLPVSEYWKQKLIELGCPKSKIIVHHMGIDIDKFTYVERVRQDGKPVQILTVGRLVEKKGHAFVLRALANIFAKNKNLTYVIAGDGPLRKNLESLVSQLNITKQVRFVGAVDQGEIRKLYDCSDIFVLSSITGSDGNQEGVPVVLMEAHAKGLPVVATYHSGIPEVTLDDKSGFLVPEKDEIALAKKIEYLIEHRERWIELGINGRVHIEKNFNNTLLNKRLNEIFLKISKESAPTFN